MAELNFTIQREYWKEEVPVDITPTNEPQTVTPEEGQAFKQVNVGAIPAPVLQDKVVTPTEQTQNVTADEGYDGLGEVEVKPIPSQYIVPSGTQNITQNGDYDITDKAGAHVAVEPDLETATVTPTESTQVVEPGTGKDGLSQVTVNPIPSQYVVPAGSVSITQNGTVSVAGKATAEVAVPGIVPTGTKQISITSNGTTTEDVAQYASAEITVNTLPEKGLVFEDYDSDGYPHSARFVGMGSTIPSGYCKNTLGYADTWNKVPTGYCKYISVLSIPDGITALGASSLYGANCKTLNLPDSLVTYGDNCCEEMHFLEELHVPDGSTFGTSSFKYNNSLKKIYFEGDVVKFGPQAFRFRDLNPWVQRTLLDFSHATYIPVKQSNDSLEASDGCVVRIPYALSDEALGVGNGWQSATNWVSMTYVTWEVVS